MTVSVSNKMLDLPNLLLIGGNGRNVGKTTLACRIIKHFSATNEITGLKISPHFHPVNEADVVFRNQYFTIVNETQINSKDSSKMLQAGAKKVWFIMVNRDYLRPAFEHLAEILPDHFIVCESGGLHEIVNPGLFFLVKRKNDKIVKTHLMSYSPIIVENDGENFDFDLQKLEFKSKRIGIKK